MLDQSTCLFLQYFILLFLLAKERNDGGKQLFKQQKWTGSHVVFIIISTHLFFGFLSLLNFCLKEDLYNLTKPYYNYFLVWFLTILLVVIIRSKEHAINALGFKKENLPFSIYLGIGVGVLGFAGYILLYLTANRVHPEIKLIENSALEDYLSSHVNIIIFFIMNVAWTPIVEESLFRGIIYSPFRKKYGPMMAICLTAILFTLGHFELSVGSIMIGILWGLLYERAESIVAPIIAHSSYNLLWFVTQLILYFR